jgi:hypothetical protein
MSKENNKKSWIEKLKSRWNLENTKQVFIVLLVFALTGTTVLVIKKPILSFLFPSGDIPLAFYIAYYILIFPIYNLFLLFYGAIFGYFSFFWDFEKKTFKRIKERFSKKN